MFAIIARIFVIGAGVFLPMACASVPVTSLPKLAALDPTTMDASQVEVAVRAPDDYDLPEDAATLVLSVWQEEGDKTREELFHLVPVPDAPTRFLNKRAKAGFMIHRLHIHPKDAPRMDDFRAHMLSLKEAPGQKSLSVSVTTRPCLKPGANPFKDPRVAIYLRPAQDEEYFTLVKERKVSIEMPDGDARYCATD
ncbi:hypothetical protein MGWOODY_Hyp1478 [hydrothermal vent metagenome]|uniref:Uncharacterized protein n=2 Tax=root TaxID=1 RepID=A0A170PTX7_9ZZZZ